MTVSLYGLMSSEYFRSKASGCSISLLIKIIFDFSYHDRRRQAASKEQKTIDASKMVIWNTFLFYKYLETLFGCTSIATNNDWNCDFESLMVLLCFWTITTLHLSSRLWNLQRKRRNRLWKKSQHQLSSIKQGKVTGKGVNSLAGKRCFRW